MKKITLKQELYVKDENDLDEILEAMEADVQSYREAGSWFETMLEDSITSIEDVEDDEE